MSNEALLCHKIADGANQLEGYKNYSNGLLLNKYVSKVISLFKQEALKGKYGMYLPNKEVLKIDAIDYYHIILLIREKGFEVHYNDELEAYYVSWKYD